MNNDILIINGKNPLLGEIEVQTSKNSTLPIMSASILANGKTILHKLPNITDVLNMKKLLQHIGTKITTSGSNLEIDTSEIENNIFDENLSKTMRSSIFLLGSMLAKFKQVSIVSPGGCKIGKRPIDIHLSAFKKLGVDISWVGNRIFFNAENARPGKIKLRIPSVGATENIMLFACTLKGETTIINPAKEPEVVDLANFLNSMGAKIIGSGTNRITIYGVDSLKCVEYTPISDRIVAGTIMCAVAGLGGKVTLKNARCEHNEKLIKILSSIGCQIKSKNDIITISKDGQTDFEQKTNSKLKITTGFYPKFPTDLQSIILSLLTACCKKATLKETVFENRFLTVKELTKMGAMITKDKNTLTILGTNLCGAHVQCKDLRGGAGLVVAGLLAEGETIIDDIYHIDRGYDHIENMFAKLGAKIKRCPKEKSSHGQ